MGNRRLALIVGASLCISTTAFAQPAEGEIEMEGDPAPAHALLKKENPNNTDEFMMFSRQMIIDGKLVTGRDADGGPEKIGQLDPARYAKQIQQLEELGILKKGKVTAAQAMTTGFLPKH